MWETGTWYRHVETSNRLSHSPSPCRSLAGLIIMARSFEKSRHSQPTYVLPKDSRPGKSSLSNAFGLACWAEENTWGSFGSCHCGFHDDFRLMKLDIFLLPLNRQQTQSSVTTQSPPLQCLDKQLTSRELRMLRYLQPSQPASP